MNSNDTPLLVFLWYEPRKSVLPARTGLKSTMPLTGFYLILTYLPDFGGVRLGGPHSESA